MMKKDKRTKDEILKIIDLVYEDTFWRSNILSPSKLRKQFTKLIMFFEDRSKEERIRFNRTQAREILKFLIRKKSKEEGYIEIQPDGVYNRNTREFYDFSLPPIQFMSKMNKNLSIRCELTEEEKKKYG